MPSTLSEALTTRNRYCIYVIILCFFNCLCNSYANAIGANAVSLRYRVPINANISILVDIHDQVMLRIPFLLVFPHLKSCAH